MEVSVKEFAKKVIETCKAEHEARVMSRKAKNVFARQTPQYIEAWSRYYMLREGIEKDAYKILERLG